MKQIYKIQENIPDFNAKFKKNQLIIDFKKDVSPLSIHHKITDETHSIHKLLISKENNEKGFSVDAKLINEHDSEIELFNDVFEPTSSYTFTDALRDCCLILVGNSPDRNLHYNIQDDKYLNKSGSFFNTNIIPDFEIKFNNSINNKKTPRIYNNSLYKMNHVERNKDVYMYINFLENVKIYTDFISGMDFISAKCLGIHILKKQNVSKFSVYSYNSDLFKGLCIFEREVLDSIFDAYDVFDVLKLLLSCVKEIDNSNYVYKYNNEEYELYDNDIPIEL